MNGAPAQKLQPALCFSPAAMCAEPHPSLISAAEKVVVSVGTLRSIPKYQYILASCHTAFSPFAPPAAAASDTSHRASTFSFTFGS